MLVNAKSRIHGGGREEEELTGIKQFWFLELGGTLVERNEKLSVIPS